jgi:hypothetical protein
MPFASVYTEAMASWELKPYGFELYRFQKTITTLKGRRLKLGNTHPRTRESLNNLIDLYEAWNKPEEAKEWRGKLAQIKAVCIGSPKMLKWSGTLE